MRLDREVRRTIAQFLNGLAVALTAALVLAPAAESTFDGIAAVAALVGAGLLHLLALKVSSDS